jgi:hypothetical protein
MQCYRYGFLNTKIMTTATTDILEKLREEIEFINKDDSREDRYYQSGLKLAFNIVKEFRAKEQIQIQDAFDNGQANYTSPRDCETGKYYFNVTFYDNTEAGI